MRTFSSQLLFVVLLGGCRTREVPTPTLAPTYPQAIEAAGLHNVFRVSDKLISGSSPEGDEGFQSLRDLGVKTIISVDGAKPDLATAKKFGLRYVHLPIGYDGVPDEQGRRIAKAVRDLPALVYIHCHHGKHRAPAAVAAVQRCLDGQCSVANAQAWLKLAGTDPHYQGLHAAPEQFAPIRANDWDAIHVDYAEQVQVNAFVDCMVTIDTHWEHLKLIRTAGWQTPPKHADLDPAHEALLLREGYRESLRIPELAKRTEMLKLLRDAEWAAAQLEQVLRSAKGQTIDTTAAEKAFQQSGALCTQCHRLHRDVPRPR